MYRSWQMLSLRCKFSDKAHPWLSYRYIQVLCMSVQMLTRIPLALLIIGLSGCGSTLIHPNVDTGTEHRQVTLTTTDNPGQIPYSEDDVKPYTPMPRSAGMERRLDMKLHELEKQMGDVERRRKELNRLLIERENRYKPLRENATDQQIAKYQAAQRASQNRIASLQAELELETARIENRLDETLAQLENHYAYQRARLEAEHRLKRTQETIRARSQTAQLSAETNMMRADEAEPVLEDGVAYYDLAGQGDRSALDGEDVELVAVHNGAEPTITSRPPSPPGDSNPDLPEQLAPPYASSDSIVVRDGDELRIKYDAVLVYHEKETRNLWTKYLRAYGETDLFESRNDEQGEYYIYLGTFDSPERAKRRLSSVEDTIGSEVNSRIVTRDLSRS